MAKRKKVEGKLKMKKKIKLANWRHIYCASIEEGWIGKRVANMGYLVSLRNSVMLELD